MRAIIRIVGVCVVFMLIYAIQTNAAAITQLTAQVSQPASTTRITVGAVG